MRWRFFSWVWGFWWVGFGGPLLPKHKRGLHHPRGTHGTGGGGGAGTLHLPLGSRNYTHECKICPFLLSLTWLPATVHFLDCLLVFSAPIWRWTERIMREIWQNLLMMPPLWLLVNDGCVQHNNMRNAYFIKVTLTFHYMCSQTFYRICNCTI